MDFTLSEDHQALRDGAETFLQKEVNLDPLRIPGATVAAAGYDEMWSKISEMGWAGAVIPEAYDGLEMSYIDLVMIIGEVGKTLAPSPLFGTLAGAWAIQHAGSEEQKKSLLAKVAGEGLKLAFAFADTGSADRLGTGVSAKPDGVGWTLSGAKGFVVDADCADKIVVAAETPSGTGFFVVDRDAQNLKVTIMPWRDLTRQVCELKLDGVPGELLSEGSDETWPWVRDRLYLVLAAESAGGARKALQTAVDYSKERVAFGRQIGAFQAIKHQLAEIAGQVELANAGVQYAAWALTEQDTKASIACAMAQSYASEAYRDATYRDIQVHGAIGFTWEMPNHLYYKRARCNAELLGSPRVQREQIMQMIEKNPSMLN